MKKTLLFLLPVIFFAGSCLVAVPKEERGKRQGWFKNRNNPHYVAPEKEKKEKAK